MLYNGLPYLSSGLRATLHRVCAQRSDLDTVNEADEKLLAACSFTCKTFSICKATLQNCAHFSLKRRLYGISNWGFLCNNGSDCSFSTKHLN